MFFDLCFAEAALPEQLFDAGFVFLTPTPRIRCCGRNCDNFR